MRRYHSQYKTYDNVSEVCAIWVYLKIYNNVNVILILLLLIILIIILTIKINVNFCEI